jgi:hypothetical protein
MAGGTAGVGGNAGAAGAGGGATGGAGGSATCGALGQACCAGATCGNSLACLNGATCSCAKTLFGRYLLRTDGAILYQSEPPATAQTPVLDASSGMPLKTVTAAVEDLRHGCAVVGPSKTVWCWRTAAGGNDIGQLGNGAADASGPTFRATQVLVAANQPLGTVVSLANTEPDAFLGGTSCAITTEGKLYCWGDLTWIVNGGTAALTSPYAIPITTDGVTPLSGVVAAAVNGAYGCVITQGASAKELSCWGQNYGGQLGTGDMADRRYPTKVVGVGSPTKIAIQSSTSGTTCALDAGNVRCWGYNGQGQAGIGSKTGPVLAPTIVTLMGGATALSGIVDIAAAAAANYPGVSCVLTATHTVLCWGYVGFQEYPTQYGVTNVVALGALSGFVNDENVRLLTSDGLYHVGAMTRAPNCGLLQ